MAVPLVMHCIGTLNIALLLIYGTPFLGSLLGRLRQTHRNIAVVEKDKVHLCFVIARTMQYIG